MSNSPPFVFADGLPFTAEGKLASENGPVAYFHGGFPFTAGHMLAVDTGAPDVIEVPPHTHDMIDVIGLQGALDDKAALIHTHALTDINGLQAALDGKAALIHTHALTDINGLQAALDGKAAASHTHAVADVTGLQVALDNINSVLQSDTGTLDTLQEIVDFIRINRADLDTLSITSIAGLQTALDGKAAASHTHAIADVTGLQAALDGKAALIHTHALTDVNGLQAALDGKAAASHTHAVADVTGLQAALDGKAPLAHTHAIVDVTGLQTALDGKAASAHTHAMMDVIGLQAALDGKANASHVHVIGDVTGLQAALDGKANTSHTQPISSITGLQAALDGKAALIHTHALTDINGLQAALDGKAAASHTHDYLPLSGGTVTGVTNFQDSVNINNASGRFLKINRGSNSVEVAVSSGARAEIWASNGTAAQNRAIAVTANGPPSFYDGGTWRDIWHAQNLQITTSTTDTTAGRVTRVGDFGVGLPIVTAETNLNAGVYVIPGNYVSPVTGVTNLPSGFTQGDRLIVEVGGDSGTLVQRMTQRGIGRFFTRTVNGGNFGASGAAWVEQYHTGNLLNIGTTAATARTALGLGSAATASVTAGNGDRTAGRVMTVGFNGWGVPITVSDFNTVTVGQNTAAIVSSAFQALNRPAGNYHSALVFSHNIAGDYESSIVTVAGQERAWLRTKNSGTWGDYRELFHTGMTIPIENGGTGATTASGARTSLGLSAVATQSPLTVSQAAARTITFNSETARNTVFFIADKAYVIGTILYCHGSGAESGTINIMAQNTLGQSPGLGLTVANFSPTGAPYTQQAGGDGFTINKNARVSISFLLGATAVTNICVTMVIVPA